MSQQVNTKHSITQKLLSMCIVGKPNAGKSSLLNNIIGHTLSIVTHKVQTTRSIITGVVNIKNTQVIILDTPGIFEPKKTLERAMVRCAWSSLHSTDIAMVIIDSSEALNHETIKILERINQHVNPVFLLNKIDLNSKSIKNIEEYILSKYHNSNIFKISATHGYGLDELLDYILSCAKNSPWLYDENAITNLPMKFLASEITRKQLFLNTHQELPYNLTVHNELWEELADGSVKINQIIVVSRENYKMMILGKRGISIKHIGLKSRKEIEEVLGIKIHLFLFIKVRNNWESSAQFLQ
ncbi:MAG: GTPase Era [Rickettsiaceae bacterium]